MKTQMHTNHRRLLALAMAIAMALTLSVSAFASDIRPWNVDNTSVIARISQTQYSATVTGAKGATKTEVSLVLYEKGGLGYKQVDSANASANSGRCTKNVSYAFKSGKTYKLEVTGKAYVNGVWDTVSDSVVQSL